MKYILIWLLSLLITPPLLAQRDIPLPGLVLRQNSRVKTGQIEYLSKVSIQATQAAAPTMSDATGSFTLVFADKPAYNVTRIFAEKSGMEVVNKTDLERAAVIGRLDKLKIVMCPAGELMENQMQYYGIAQEAIVSRFKKRIAALEAANADLDELIAEINDEYNLQLKTKNEAIYALEKEWNEALAYAHETAQKFAAINLDDADSLYLQADAAFQKGDFTRVLQLLQYDLLDKNLRNIRSNLSAADSLNTEGRARIARGQENLRQTIQNALFAARVAKLDGEWKRAEAYYDLAVKGDEQDVEIVFEVAHYLQLQNQFAKARTYYEKALTQTSRPFKKSSILNNLGVLLQKNNEMGGAKQSYEEALQIRRKLAEKTPDVYLPYVAMTLNNLGVLLSDNNEMGGAKKSYEEALQIRRKLAEKNPDVYLPDVAMTLNNLGALFYTDNEMGGAQQSYEEALQIYRKLADKNPWVYNLGVALTDINVGLFYEQLLKSTGEMSIKAAGLELMRDAEQRLAIFPDAHPRVQEYRPKIERLTQFFNDFDEAAFQLQKQIERLSALETANETEKDPHKKVQRQQEIISLLSEIEKAMPGNEEVANLIAARYGSLAWYQLFVRQFAEAEQSARAGLAKDPSEEWINTNLALALLYQDKWEAAKQIYEKLKDKPYNDSTYLTTFLEDLEALEKEGITHPDVQKARALLKN